MSAPNSVQRHPGSLGIAAVLVALLFVRPASAQQTAVRYADVKDGAYAVVAEVRAKPGKADELRRITLPLMERVRREPNNLVYFVHEDREAPGHFIFYEIFVTKADFEAHNATAHVQSWFARLPELAQGGVQVVHMRVAGVQP